MREIEFRAWDGKRYHYDDFMIRNGHAYCFGEFSRDELHLMDWTIEQYTGLKDKNGKEIYEGDIVRCTSEYFSTINRESKDIVLTESKVGYENGTTWLYTLEPNGDCWDQYALHSVQPVDDRQLEIIGNIHEDGIEG